MSELVIVGGGLAGGAAAALLAQGGRRPLLLERASGPHDKICGEFLSTEAQAHLRALGFDVARLGGAPIDTVRLVHGRRCSTARLPFTGVGLTRRRLDAALLEHAAAAGVKVAAEVTVRRVDDGRLATSAGDLQPATLLLANGKHEVRGSARDTSGTVNQLVGFKMYFRVPAAVRSGLAGAIEVVLFEGGYAGLQLVEDGVVNLCLLVGPERLAAAGGRWEAVFATLLADEPLLASRLGEATPLLAKPLTIAGVPYGFMHRASTGAAFRLGDQAAVIPSFSGDGMSIALHSARLAAQSVLSGGTAVDYHRRLVGDVGAQVARATWLQRGGQTRLGRAALVAGLGLWPGALRLIATATRVPEPALRRAGLRPDASVFRPALQG